MSVNVFTDITVIYLLGKFAHELSKPMTPPRHSAHGPSNRPFKRSAVLTDFEQSLSSRVDDRQTVLEVLGAVQHWTNGQPTLSKILCSCVLKQADLDGKGPDRNALGRRAVDTIVQRQIVDRWKTNQAAIHLNKIADAVLSYEIRDSLLILYLQILQRGAIAANHSPEQEVLLRSGLVELDDGQLSVSNPVYAKVFDVSWIEKQLPGITRPVSIVSTEPRRRSSARAARASRKLAAALLSLAAIAGVGFLLLRVFDKGTQPTTDSASSAKISTVSTGRVAAAAGAASSGQPAEGITQLTLLADTFSGYSTFRDAEFQTALKEVGLAVNYADEFDQSLRAQKLSDGDADLLMTTLDQYLQQQPSGKIIGLIDRTVGADAVVLNTKRYPGLKSLLDLETQVKQSLEAGETLSITYAEDTPSEYLAMVLDAQFDNFDLADFELKPVADASEAWALLQNPTDNVAIAVLWEPYVTKARQQGYSVVLSSDDAPSAIVDVLVASNQLLDSNPSVISQLLATYYRRIDANSRDASQLQEQVASDGNLPINEAMSIINGIDFFTALEAENWMNDGTLETRIGATAAILNLANELDTVPSDAKALYTSEYLVEAANNTATLIELVRADNPALADTLAGEGNTATIPAVSASQLQQAPDIGILDTPGQVSFESGSAQLTEEGSKTLSDLAIALKEFNGQNVAVRVIGHTSRTGSLAANQQLSQARASIVVATLKGFGVALNLLPEGKGSSEPLPGVDPAAVQNQRTEVRLVRVN
ncbi:MAG: phosphate ABC transporter substrate-binding/OmpA family protein [Phormidesmis sp.]